MLNDLCSTFFCFAQDLLYKHASDLPGDVSVNVPINYPDKPLSTVTDLQRHALRGAGNATQDNSGGQTSFLEPGCESPGYQLPLIPNHSSSINHQPLSSLLTLPLIQRLNTHIKHVLRSNRYMPAPKPMHTINTRPLYMTNRIHNIQSRKRILRTNRRSLRSQKHGTATHGP